MTDDAAILFGFADPKANYEEEEQQDLEEAMKIEEAEIERELQFFNEKQENAVNQSHKTKKAAKL